MPIYPFQGHKPQGASSAHVAPAAQLICNVTIGARRCVVDRGIRRDKDGSIGIQHNPADTQSPNSVR